MQLPRPDTETVPIVATTTIGDDAYWQVSQRMMTAGTSHEDPEGRQSEGGSGDLGGRETNSIIREDQARSLRLNGEAICSVGSICTIGRLYGRSMHPDNGG